MSLLLSSLIGRELLQRTMHAKVIIGQNSAARILSMERTCGDIPGGVQWESSIASLGKEISIKHLEGATRVDRDGHAYRCPQSEMLLQLARVSTSQYPVQGKRNSIPISILVNQSQYSYAYHPCCAHHTRPWLQTYVHRSRWGQCGAHSVIDLELHTSGSRAGEC